MAEDKNVFSPQAVSTLAVKAIQDRAENPGGGLKTGISTVDAVLNPHRPGELRVVLGYTSNYKSGLMNYIARHNARRFAEEATPRVVVTVTWEQSVEEQGVMDIAQLANLDATKLMRGELERTDWTRMLQGAVRRGALPWWVFGHSSEAGERRPRLSITDVSDALAYLVDVQKVNVGLVALDYLQRIRTEGGGELREKFMSIVDRCKDMALAFRVPVMLGTQAGRQVKARTWRLPQTEDGQETSNLEQSADSFLSLWLPKQDYPVGQVIEYGDQSYRVTENLLILGVMKQKFGPAPRVFGLHVDPREGVIAPMVKQNLNGFGAN